MGLLLPEILYDASPILQGLFGTFFTWFVTAVGAAIIFVVPQNLSPFYEGLFLDCCLGFASGVMLAASYWSLLAPSIEMAEEEGYGPWSFVPAAIGFFGGCAFVFVADRLLPTDPTTLPHQKGGRNEKRNGRETERKKAQTEKLKTWRRLLLLVVAVTIHNFPEGLAVGVGYGAAKLSERTSIDNADLLAIGIGIQNFPEGMAVSLPLRRLGYSPFICFFYGQLSGMVEPIGGFLGAAAVTYAEPCLPYALSFAAGAMVYVVVDSLVPEYHSRGNKEVGTWGCVIGFLVMMALDVALG